MSETQGESKGTNGLAIASLVLAFFIPLIGLILGVVSLGQIKKTKENGKGLAIAGVVLSALFMLIFLVLIIALIASGSTKKAVDDTSSSVNSSSVSSTPASNSSARKIYRFNERADKQTKDIEVIPSETATINGVKMTVQSVEYKTSVSDYETAASGKTYVIANVAIENTSDKTQPYNEYDFRIQTAGGQVLDGTFVTLPSPLNSGDLVSGGKVQGQIVFEVPVEDGHQYIIWKPSAFDSTRAIIQAK